MLETCWRKIPWGVSHQFESNFFCTMCECVSTADILQLPQPLSQKSVTGLSYSYTIMSYDMLQYQGHWKQGTRKTSLVIGKTLCSMGGFITSTFFSLFVLLLPQTIITNSDVLSENHPFFLLSFIKQQLSHYHLLLPSFNKKKFMEGWTWTSNSMSLWHTFGHLAGTLTNAGRLSAIFWSLWALTTLDILPRY